MTYPSISKEDYVAAGERKGLTLIGESPANIRDKAEWKCDRCGTIHHKSLRAVRQARKGCSCQTPDALTVGDYRDLGTRMGIEWVGQLRPRNTKTPTLWKNTQTGAVVEASYYELGYHHIRRELRDVLGIIVSADLPQMVRDFIRRLGDGGNIEDNDSQEVVRWLQENEILDPSSPGLSDLSPIGERLYEEIIRDRERIAV